MATLPPKKNKKKPLPVIPKKSAPPTRAVKPAGSFSAAQYDADACGEKIMLYAESGMGKTTLAATAPNPVFIGLDDGARKIYNPITNEPLHYIVGVESFDDVKTVLSTPAIWEDYDTIVIDTATLLQEWAIPFLLQTINHEKGGRCVNIEGYGYGKGYRHLYDTMHDLLPLLDAITAAGKNVIVICQAANIQVANAGSDDYVKEGPRLYDGSAKIPSVARAFMERMDHVCRIGYGGRVVEDKKITGGNDRYVFINAEPWFFAKSRTVHIEGAITFNEPADDSLWQFIFPEDE